MARRKYKMKGMRHKDTIATIYKSDTDFKAHGWLFNFGNKFIFPIDRQFLVLKLKFRSAKLRQKHSVSNLNGHL